MDTKPIYILTNSNDGEHTDLVAERLHTLGDTVVRIDSDRIANGNLPCTVDANGARGMLFLGSDQPAEPRSVWYRRPNIFNSPVEDQVQRSYTEGELRAFFAGLCALYPGSFWMSRPTALEAARLKLPQLRIARGCGFRTPETIFTNSPASVRAFVTEHGTSIYKAVSNELFDYGSYGFNVPTTLLTAELLDKIDLIRYCPGVIQRYVPKRYELRITIVGHELFCVQINSQSRSETSIDWRDPHSLMSIEYRVTDLDPAVRNACLKLMERYDLQFAAIDLAVDPDGSVWFFEINPNGQWYWLEYKTGIPIAEAIALRLHVATEGR